MSKNDEPDVLIVGGGIGGLATALSLARNGMNVQVLEQAFEFGEIGAGIQLAPNAMRVLDYLGVAKAIKESAVFPMRAVLMSAVSGERITTMNFGAEFEKKFEYPYIVMHRSDLLTELVTACREIRLVELVNDKKVVHIAQDERCCSVRCEDGSTYTAPLAIGADGIWSTVRDYTLGDGDPTCVGDVAYRGAVPIEDISGQAGEDNVVWWIGPSMHLIQYPIRRAELFNQVAVFTSDQYSTGSKDWGNAEELELHFSGKTEFVREGVRLINRDRRWELHDREPVDNWSRGRVTLMGDAAHPMLQYLAQGACQALEDSVVLARSLGKYPNDYKEAYRHYQDARLNRTGMVQRWSRHMGEIVHMDNIGAVLRDELLHNKTPDDYRYVEWLYGYDATSI